MWHEETIVSFRPPFLMIYDLEKKKLTTVELESHREDKKEPWWAAEIHGFDGETVILRNEAQIFGYRLASQKQFPIFRKSKGEIAGFGNKHLYVIKYRDKSYESGSYLFDLVMIDIESKATEVLIPDLGRSKFAGAELVQVIPTREKLYVWVRKSKQWKSFPW
jgi:hypothetical protein